MKQFILCLDQGTTGNTALLLDEKLNIAAQHNIEFTQHYPQNTWVEHDSREIWQSMLTAIETVLENANITGQQIAAIGITNQRETTVLWDKKTGEPIAPAIVWQCKRSHAICQQLKQHEALIHEKTGLFMDPYFSASKIRWLLDHHPKAKNLAQSGQLAFGTMDSFLLHMLSQGKKHCTDVSNASRTLLMNIHDLTWDKELLDLFNLPHSILPEICDSSAVVGHTQGLRILPDGIPIAGIAGDQQAALFGQACFEEGQAKCTYGTGAFLLQNLGNKRPISDQGLLTTVAWRINGKTHYALEGSVFIAGAAVSWLRDQLGIIKNSSEIETLAKAVNNSDGVMFIPCLSGLGAPYWQPQAKGMITGLTRSSNKAHIAYACLEGIAQQVCDLIKAFETTTGQSFEHLKVDGGACKNDLLMQIQTDLLGFNLHRPQYLETTAIGAGMLAGLAVNFYPDQNYLQKNLSMDSHFNAQMTAKDRLQKRMFWEKLLHAHTAHEN
ncbi:MAG TPA: glycerol kinase GlpK [Oligoflexia bacterium]|nr:glycerol kinase GlpK [Oligoflexia bacterium]HMR25564.1 glycerol kinase GlpK [Oligoflexia bacterium]